MKALFWLCIVLLFISFQTSWAQTVVTDVSPDPGSSHVGSATAIEVEFSAAIDHSTVSASSAGILGAMTGYCSFTSLYDIATNTLTLTPASPFKNGERVTVILTANIDDAIGNPVVPYLFSFTVEYAGGAGSFVQSATAPVGNTPEGIGTVDLDMDGDLDFIVASYYSSSAFIFENTGGGNIAQRAVLPIGSLPQAVPMAVGDFDRDGDNDVVIPVRGSMRLAFIWNDGGWNFHTTTYYIGASPIGVTAGDMDRDGDLDLVVANLHTLKVMQNNGSGGFSVKWSTNPGGQPHSPAVADFDGDGDLDVAVSRYSAGSIVVYSGNGNLGLSYSASYTVGSQPRTVETADFDLDGDPDLIVANSGCDYVTLLTNNGSGLFTASQISAGPAPHTATPFDLEGDGDDDLIISNGLFLINDGSGSFTQSGSASIHEYPVVGDFDLDGDADIARVSNTAHVLRILLNYDPNSPPIADAGAPTTYECTSASGTPVQLDGSGSSDPDGDPLTYTWEIGGNVVAGPTTSSISTVSLPVGSYQITLTVSDPDAATDTDVVSVQVEDNTAPQISVTLTPSVLWPPNHKMKEIEADVTVSDNCSAQYTLYSITSSEPDGPKGDIQSALIGTPDDVFKLRSERLGGGTGRIYTVVYQAIDGSGNTTLAFASVTVPLSAAKSGATFSALPGEFSLEQNYPNPFNPSTVLSYAIPDDGFTTLRVFNPLGQLVSTLVSDHRAAGMHEAIFNAQALPSGIYIYQLIWNEQIISRRMTLMK